MENFVEFKVNDDDNSVVLLTSTEDLYYLQDDIYELLSQIKGENFTVVVDLFLRNGFSFNRFIVLRYDGKEQCESFVLNPREVTDEIKNIIRQYLRNHKDLLDNSALSRRVIDFVVN